MCGGFCEFHGDMVGANKQGSSCQMNGGSVALLSPRFPQLLQPNATSVDRVCLNDRYDLLIGEIERQLIK